jgi:hypothetical protein
MLSHLQKLFLIFNVVRVAAWHPTLGVLLLVTAWNNYFLYSQSGNSMSQAEHDV